MRYLIVLFVFCASCAQPQEPRSREAAGGKVYGGVFSVNETQQPRSLFPLSITQAVGQRIGSQIFEGLVRFDQRDLSIEPALAESWELDSTARVYTFHLRKGVRFHDDPCFPGGTGRELTGQDVLKAFTALCSASEHNQMEWLLLDQVVGARTHYAATLRGKPSEGVKGFELVDPWTFRITLNAVWPNFLQVLAHQGCWITAPEALAHYGKDVIWHPVGTGPFKLAMLERGQVMVLERWAQHWDRDEHGNALPFLDAVRITFEPEKTVELAAFETGRLSLVYELPLDRTDMIGTVNGRYQVQEIPALVTQFYGFNRNLAPFQDVRIRQAFALAIDRDLLVDSVLKGVAVPARHGIVPPGFKDYPYDSVPALRFDPAKARQLLAAAGYPDGRGLPTVHLNVNGEGLGYVQVADVVQGMLAKHLNAQVVTTVLPSDQFSSRVEKGQAAFWREGWVADHPDPENFLALFHGRNAPEQASDPAYLNSTRFRDARYDSLYVSAQRQNNSAERNLLLARAESCMMDQWAILPLYHERSVRLLQPNVRDLSINGMEYRDLRAVWLDPKAPVSRVVANGN